MLKHLDENYVESSDTDSEKIYEAADKLSKREVETLVVIKMRKAGSLSESKKIVHSFDWGGIYGIRWVFVMKRINVLKVPCNIYIFKLTIICIFDTINTT